MQTIGKLKSGICGDNSSSQNIPDATLEFHLVAPLPEDATGNILGQIVLVQRPQRFQRSVILSIYDSAYDRGQAHSHAVVMGDRIDLHSVQVMAEFTEDCPPEMPSNDCTLWFGSRQIESSERECLRAVGMPFDSLCIEPQFPQKTALRLPTCNVD